MSAFKPYSHLISSPRASESPRQSSSSSPPALASIFEQEDQVGEVTRLPSPDSSAKQLDYSVDKLLHRHKPGQMGSSRCGSVPHETFAGPSSNQLSSSSLATLPLELSSSSHWSNLNLLAHTLWWQKQKVSSSLHVSSETPLPPPHHQQQLDSSETLFSAMTMASAASLYSPHLRRLLLPLTSSSSVTGPRSQRGPRRQRTTFTHEQTLRLEMEYHVSEYISRGKRFQLAELLDLTESQIKIWFQNRRAKDKRIEKAVNEQQFRLLPMTHSTTSAPGHAIHTSTSDPCSTCDYTASFSAAKQLLDTSARKDSTQLE